MYPYLVLDLDGTILMESVGIYLQSMLFES